MKFILLALSITSFIYFPQKIYCNEIETIGNKNNQNKLELNLRELKNVEYSEENIPILIGIKNISLQPIKILNPYDNKGKYLECFEFEIDQLDNHYGVFISPRQFTIQDIKFASYITLAPQQECFFPVELNKMSLKEIRPGNYKISILYRNELGENCFKGEVAASKYLNISVKSEPDDLILPEYISKEEALKLATKTLLNGNAQSELAKYYNIDKITVALRKGIYIITYPAIPLPPMTLGSNYGVRIRLDAKTGKALSVQF